MSDPGQVQTYRCYRHVEAFRYLGRFDLTFLEDGEQVGRHTNLLGAGSVLVVTTGANVLVPLGDWLIRDDDGSLSAMTPAEFAARFELAPDETDDNDRLVDPDCKAGKHKSCVGGPCECGCHDREVGPW